MLRAKRVTKEVDVPMETADQSHESTGDLRDLGVSDEDWAELEEAKKHYAERIERLKREKREAELAEELRKQQAMQERIRRLCPCPAGFTWTKVSGGWRCAGGAHFVTDKQLEANFMV